MASNLIEDALRDVMRNVPSPVTIVTFAAADGPRGVTIGSFTSVSLAPPLVSFNVMLESTAHDDLVRADRFRVHVLREDQAVLSERFAFPEMSSKAQFDSIAYVVDEGGVPQLDDVLAVLHCRHFEAIGAGDHTLILGEVVKAESFDSGKPLIYYKSSYREIGDEVFPDIRHQEVR